MNGNNANNSNKQFGILFSIFFLLLFVILFYHQNQITFIYLIISLFFFLLSFLRPIIFHYPNIIWINFGNLLGLLTTPIILGIIYLTLFLPIGFLLKVFNHDALDLKINKKKISYWKVYKPKNINFTKQY